MITHPLHPKTAQPSTPFHTRLKTLTLLLLLPAALPAKSSPFVTLNPAAISATLDSIGMIVGATYDEEQNVINLIGDGQHLEASPTLQQVAVALSWAFSDSAGYYYLSIDPLSSSPEERWMKVRMAEVARNTDFGYVMFEADRIMKTISLAIDNITRLPVGDFPCKSMFDILGEDKPNRDKKEVWSRFWLYPHSNTVEASGQSMLIKEARMGVLTEKMKWVGDELISLEGLKDPEADAFAQCFTENYQAIADKELIFRQLEQLMRLLLVSEWIREKGIPVSLDWIDTYKSEIFQMPFYTPAIKNQRENREQDGKRVTIHTQQLFGGTDLNVEPNFTVQSNAAREWEARAVKASSNFNESGKFRFQSGQQSFSAVSFPAANYNVSPRQMAKVIAVGPESGPRIEVYKRAVPKAENHRLPIDKGWEIALPGMSVYNPHGRAGERRTLNGIPERDITLYDPAGRTLGRFSKLDFDATGRAFIRAENPANPWRIFPDESSQTLWAVHENTIWAFDSKTGLLKGQQIGDQLIQYHWSFFSGPFSKTILEEITSGPHSVKFEHGNGGLKITGLTASDGRKVSFLPADPAEMVTAKVRHFNTPEAPPTEMNINSGNGNWELAGERNIMDNYYFLNRHGRAIGQILASGKRRKRPYTILFPDGGHTLVISNGEITIVPFRMSDFLRRKEYRHFSGWQVDGIKKMEDGKTKVLLETEGEQSLIYLDNRERELTHCFFGNDAREFYKFDPGMESAENAALEIKGITNMPEEMGVVDLRIGKNTMRMTYSRTPGEVEFASIDPTTGRKIADVESFSKKFYEDRSGKITAEDFKRETKPYFDYLKSFVEKTGKKTYLTKESDYTDANLIWKIHNGDPTVKFRRDQHDIQKSIDFYTSPVYLERDSFITLSTFDWQATGNTGLYQALEKLAGQAGTPQRQNVSWKDFTDVLRDSAYRQITLFTQTDSNGLAFVGERVSFQRIAQELDALGHIKDLVNIVSDRQDGIQELFANSGKVRRVVTSGCEYRDATSVGYAMEQLQEAYRTFGQTAELPPRQFEEILSSYKDIDVKGVIGDKLAETEGKVTIKVGQLTQRQKRSLAFGFLNEIKAYIQGPSKEYNTSIEDWMNKVNDERIKSLQRDAKKELNEQFLIKSILRLKVYNMPSRLKQNLFSNPGYNPSRHG